MLAALINGSIVSDVNRAVSIEERGLTYGDGLFETMTLRGGAIRFFESHLARLRLGCKRLGIIAPQDAELGSDIVALSRVHPDGIVKIIVTRGAGGRGYRADKALAATRIALLYPAAITLQSREIRVRWCVTRLARNPLLAGIKHLNRLENVLAQNEWSDTAIAEGLMLDTEGELIGATASNLFIVSDGTLITPDLRFSGIRGVLREQVLSAAKKAGIAAEERALRPDDLIGTTEIFVTNAVRGIRPVVALDEHHWPVGAITTRLAALLNLW